MKLAYRKHATLAGLVDLGFELEQDPEVKDKMEREFLVKGKALFDEWCVPRPFASLWRPHTHDSTQPAKARGQGKTGIASKEGPAHWHSVSTQVRGGEGSRAPREVPAVGIVGDACLGKRPGDRLLVLSALDLLWIHRLIGESGRPSTS